MSADETGEARGGNVLSGLLSPLRLPERVITGLEKLTGDVGSIRVDVHRVREQTEPLGDILPALDRLEHALGARLDSLHETIEALEGNESHLNKTVQQLVHELSAMHNTLHGLQDSVKRVTDRLPDQEDDDKRGPLKVARDVLTGND